MRGQVFTGSLLVAGLLMSACSGGSMPGTGNAFVPQESLRSATTNAVVNGNFATGKLAPWVGVGQRAGVGTVTNKYHYTGDKYAGFMGTTTDPAVNKAHGMAQILTIPKTAKTLTWYHAGTSTDEAKYGYDEVHVIVGTKDTVCYGGSGFSDTGTKIVWKKGSCAISKWAGQKVTIQFDVVDNGYAKAYVNWYIDNVTIQ